MSPAEFINARARGARAPLAPGWLAHVTVNVFCETHECPE